MTVALVLSRLVETPALVDELRTLPPPAFAALVRQIGVEDAGGIVALATTEQLVAAFDEDLFANARPGEREAFDAGRFATWLEILREAGDGVAAARVAELSLDFVVHALGELMLVLDHQALLLHMADGGAAARRVDKAIDGSLSEELDGYLLVARRVDGWDAALAVVLALDRDHRAFLERVLDRCCAIAGAQLDDLDALADVLTEQDALVDAVDAEREARRAAAGHVEPRQAKAFLAHARGPFQPPRDPITRAYFRELALAPVVAAAIPDELRAAIAGVAAYHDGARTLAAPASPLGEALQRLDPATRDARMAELAYLANVLVAAGTTPAGDRYAPHAAGVEVLAVVERALVRRDACDVAAIAEVLRAVECDRLFREASAC
jgi:hypothetical protein